MDEQQVVVDLVVKGELFFFVVFVGFGKSVIVLEMVCVMWGKKIFYLVYNMEVRKDVEQKFCWVGILWVDVCIISQFVWCVYVDMYKECMDLCVFVVLVKEVVKVFGLKIQDFGDKFVLDGYMQVWIVVDIIEWFCNLNYVKIIECNVYIFVVGFGEVVIEVVCVYLVCLVWVLWQQFILLYFKFCFIMNYVFKLVVEGGRNYGYDVVFIDEVQDFNDVMMKFLKNQKGVQGILIGDLVQVLYVWCGVFDQILCYQGFKLYFIQFFWFGDVVVEEVMKYLFYMEIGVIIKGLLIIKDMVVEDDMDEFDVVLCWINVGLMIYVMSYLMVGKWVVMVKGIKQILDVVYVVCDLMVGCKMNNLELSVFDNWVELVEYVMYEFGGGYFKVMVKFINVYGISKFIDVCNKMMLYCDLYDVVVIICYLIKGLEWDNVQVVDDFFEFELFENLLIEQFELGVIDKYEVMIYYVVVIRVKCCLDWGGLKWIDCYELVIDVV